MKKRLKKKTGYKKSATAKKLQVTDREIAGYRAEVTKANRRISALRNAGYEPKMLTFILSAIDAYEFPTISKINTQHDFINMYNLVRVFNKSKTTTVRGAIREEQERYKNFVDTLEKTLGYAVPDDISRALYPHMAGMDWADLRRRYDYEEIKTMMYELHVVGVAPTNFYVKLGLDEGIHVALGYYLQDYIPRDVLFSGINYEIRDFDFYINFALKNGVNAAIGEYQSDKMVGELEDYDFLD